jgi:hypothetical protein
MLCAGEWDVGGWRDSDWFMPFALLAWINPRFLAVGLLR